MMIGHIAIIAIIATATATTMMGANMKFVKDDGGRAAAGHGGEVNDCVCRAVAVATERPYQEIYDRLEAMIKAKFGPTKRPRGVESRLHHDLMTSLGWVWVPANNVRLRKDHLPPGRLVVCITEHAVAVVDGIIHDMADCSRYGNRYIRGYFKRGVSASTPMESGRKKMLDAVTKILALADSTEHEAEAATAKAKAAELIAKHNLTAGDPNISGGRPQTDGEMRGGAAVPSYEFDLLDTVGKLCGVLVLRCGPDYKFFGSPPDLEAFHYMREIVSTQQDHAWMEYLSRNPTSARQKVSWKYSFSQGVGAKIDNLMRAAEVQQKAMRQDLVLVHRHEQAKDEYETLFGKLGGGGGGYGGERNPDGFEAGTNVSLSKGVKSSSPVRQITHQASGRHRSC